jgi:hypothetical protein
MLHFSHFVWVVLLFPWQSKRCSLLFWWKRLASNIEWPPLEEILKMIKQEVDLRDVGGEGNTAFSCNVRPL